MFYRVLPSLLVVSFLLGAAACDKNDGPTSPSPPTRPFYMAIGASDAVGHGSSVPCFEADSDCGTGTGYPQRIIRRYRQEHGETSYRNTGVPGQVMSPAIQTLARQLGRDGGNFMDRQVQFVRAEMTMITIFAGGNDANVIGDTLRAGLGGPDPRAFIDAQVRQWGEDYAEMIRRIRSQAPNARVVVFNLPNLGAMPYVAGNPVIERSMLQRIAVGLSDQANAMASRGALIVDLMCEPRIYNPANFFSDGFHPNDAGYALMAELGYPVVANGLASAPLSSCRERTLLPVF